MGVGFPKNKWENLSVKVERTILYSMKARVRFSKGTTPCRLNRILALSVYRVVMVNASAATAMPFEALRVMNIFSLGE